MRYAKKILIISLLFCSCQQSAKVEYIGNCQYIVITTNYQITSITHKGDCDNPIHEYQEAEDTSLFKIAGNVRVGR